MQKTAPLDSIVEAQSARSSYVVPKAVAPARPKRAMPSRLLGLLLVSAFSAVAWYLIFRLVISLFHA
jgi:hypothetical protein